MLTYVKPAATLVDGEPAIARVRQPEKFGRVMPEAGDWVPGNEFYVKRLRDGSLVPAEPPVEPAPEAEAANPAEMSETAADEA